MSDFLEYSFRIHGPTPATIPMSRLVAYMAEIVRLMGCQDAVHLSRIEDGSVAIVMVVSQSEVPIISPRIRNASTGDSNADGVAPWRKINEYLAEDGWGAEMRLPKGVELIVFPGKTKAATIIRSFNQPTSVQGRLVRLEGAGETVRVGLEIDGDLTARISIDAKSAQQLAAFFHRFVRLNGEGRWRRNADGRWSLDNLAASSFELLDDDDLKHALQRLGQTIPPGTGNEILESIAELRTA